MKRETLRVTGMSCGGCERAVETALSGLDGVSRADADSEAGSVEVVVEDDVTDGDLAGAVERAGFDVAT